MSFADFPEQEQVVQLLQRSLEQNRLAHGYLFAGSDLAELEAMAQTLAKALNCQAPPRRGSGGLSLDSCDQCLSCRKINEQNHPDILALRAESKSRIISVDQVRDLMQTVNLKPTFAEYKVAIIVAADRLNAQAANAFLKTLEEPPAKSILILLSTEPQRVLETILSRCLRLNFAGERKVSEAELAWLSSFADAAANSKGGLLGRYRLLSVIMKTLVEKKEQIDKHLTEQSPLERYDDLDPKLREKYEDELSAAIEAEYRHQRADLLLNLQHLLRDVWLQTMTVGETLSNFPQMAAVTKQIAQRISPVEARQNLEVFEQTQRLLRGNIQEALALEVGLLKLKL
ncbi:MAG: DNA-directed polymerase [Verrucomicrobiales bacterium]|nr:DNA-directed polymerase [Verrucomicrobiales bacterium]